MHESKREWEKEEYDQERWFSWQLRVFIRNIWATLSNTTKWSGKITAEVNTHILAKELEYGDYGQGGLPGLKISYRN